VRAEKTAADKVTDHDGGHNGRSEEEKVSDQAVNGAKVEVH
jgi:hypothetical protein